MPPTRKIEKSTPLQRGLACLACRKRKLKCDGKRPVCSSCIKMKRDGECEYEDKKQKSRTQKLKEKLAMLEERIRELEGPEDGESGTAAASSGSPGLYDPPVQLHDTAQLLGLPDLDNIDFSTLADVGGSRPVSVAGWPSFSASSSASSSSGSLGPVSRSVTGSPFATGSDNEVDLDQLLSISISGSNMEFSNPFNNGLVNTSFSNLLHWDPKSPLPEENKQILLDIFYAHRHQCWFDGDFSRFDPTKSPHLHVQQMHQQVTEPHPALWNSIYLLACYFARSPFLVELENNFLTRTLHEITVALDNSDRLSDVVQASCLLAVYLFSNSRILEGYCHSFSAARLAVGLGLHQLQHPKSFSSQGASYRSDNSPSTSSNPLPGLITGLGPSGASPIPIPPPKNSFELRNRISAFWQVFMVDRCWSVANGLPVALPDGEHHRGRIKTPWPEPPDEEVMNNDSSFSGVYMPALKAKAATLYERTFRLASASNKTDTYWVEYNKTLHALQRFSSCVPFFVGYEAWRTQAPFLDVELFSVHTLVNVCNIHLHGGVVQSSEIDLSNGSVPLQAANFIMSLIRQLSQGDYEYLDPLVSACWLSVAKLYIRLLNAVAVGTMTSLPAYALEGELDVIVNAMRTLSVFVPLAGEHAKKVEEERGFAGSVI
ncbi:hypothetical protein E1B28_002395 [Marasmius oreades]|uniref:Zn(2)-C6 fungal-type domain-containing protein n=1 Tax=Marasmius oreades TaxID=181124 RepID=A0A9P7RMJ4_9AGAR|nr:uncharacterized protein E1B28_002395 [Marasmius oreades]KAG7086441.1 hypothetical protein E1B28_002395 [Marasmius oreades]